MTFTFFLAWSELWFSITPSYEVYFANWTYHQNQHNALFDLALVWWVSEIMKLWACQELMLYMTILDSNLTQLTWIDSIKIHLRSIKWLHIFIDVKNPIDSKNTVDFAKLKNELEKVVGHYHLCLHGQCGYDIDCLLQNLFLHPVSWSLPMSYYVKFSPYWLVGFKEFFALF